MTRILIVDHEVDVAESLAVLFAGMGHDAKAVLDARQALDVAKAFRPRIALLDLSMPQLDGFQLASALRSLPDIDPPYLIALTPLDGARVNTAVKAVGFDTYVRKPADVMTLISIVTEVAAQQQSRHGIDPPGEVPGRR